MFCKYCGKELDDDAKFCKYCGKIVRGEAKTEDQKNSAKGLSIGGFVVAVVALVCSLFPRGLIAFLFSVYTFIPGFILCVVGMVLSVVGMAIDEKNNLSFAGFVIAACGMLICGIRTFFPFWIYFCVKTLI